MLVYRGITDAIIIRDKFANHFYDNLSYQLQNWPNISENLTNPHHDYDLYLFSKLLKKLRKILEQYGFSLPNYTWQAYNSLFQRELDYNS